MIRTIMASRKIGRCMHVLAARGQARAPVALSQVRQFHFSPRRPIPPVLWILVKPVMKVAAALTGRGVRKWYKALPADAKRTVWIRMSQNWPVFAAMGGLTGVWGVYYYQSHIIPAPVTGRKRFIAVSHEQLMKISDAEVQVYLDQYQDKLLSTQSNGSQLVLKVASRLVSCNPELQSMHVEKWKVTVIDDTGVNAFVVPNGHIFVFTGLLEIAHNEDKLAMILGHEMAHAYLSHSAEKISFAQMLDVLVITVMAALWTLMPTDGIAIVTQWFYNRVIDLMLHMPYSRLLEKEADKVGMQLAAKACYDVRQGSVFWKQLQLLDKVDGGGVPEWLSTHPAHEKRVAHIDHLVPEATKLREMCKCPPLPKIDPRDQVTILEKEVNNIVTATKAGQNLKRVALKTR